MRIFTLVLVTLLMVGCGESPPPAAPTEAAAPKAAPAPPADSDGDGIIDATDACPGTASGAKVDARGCESDSDGDGVVDSADNCPDSAAATEVDAAGCKARLMEAKEFTLRVDFAVGSAKIVGDIANGLLVDVVALLNQHPESSVRVEGHTDSSGSASGNLRISGLRAKAVAEVLERQLGIDASRISTEGMGDTKPIASNDSAEGRDENRRVVVVVLPGA